MPELPEVEVIRRGLAPVLVGRRFTGVRVGRHRLRRQSSLREFHRWVTGRTLEALTRRGKYLLFHLEGGATLLVHLGMTGRLLLGSAGTKAAPHVHVTFRFDDGMHLRFQDVRRFGQMLVFRPGQRLEPLTPVGPEPFSRRVTPGWLLSLARGRGKPLKSFLLDGQALAGIGNIYACEILFAAGLSPLLPAGSLSLSQWERLLRETRRILRMAIRRGGTTLADYLNSHGETGLFQLELAVYGREGEPCPRCGTPVSRLIQAGRSTFLCARCQRTGPPRH